MSWHVQTIAVLDDVTLGNRTNLLTCPVSASNAMSSYVHTSRTHPEVGEWEQVNEAPPISPTKGSKSIFSNQNFLQLEEKKLLRRALFSHPFYIQINIDQGSVYTQYKLETKTYTE